MSRNPPWERDELILALDLYVRSGFHKRGLRLTQSSAEVIELSDVLNRLPIHMLRPDEERFRNPNGVYMKMSNFLSLDPEYPGKGLEAGGKRDEEVWHEFADDTERLHRVADAIRRNLAAGDSDDIRLPIPGETEAIEGKLLYRLHAARERNQAIVRKRKQLALDRFGRLMCEVCGFDFHAIYGELGAGFIECHHVVPLSQLTPGRATRIGDLALVCANCHRMLHRSRDVLTIEGLRQIAVADVRR